MNHLKNTEHTPIYRLSQLLSLLLGARIFVLIFLAFTLYVSTFFLISQEADLRKIVFDIKIHGIIFCSILSIAAGGLINQFYDKEKDKMIMPFRSNLQRFLKQKYFLYFYLILNFLSLGIAAFLSFRILVFFIIYQFVIWFYSHKLSKVLVVNNLTYVLLSLYPFFGMLVYYQHFSLKLFWMAIFLFFLLLTIDMIKDLLTRKADSVFGYKTIPIVFGEKITIYLLMTILIVNMIISGLIVESMDMKFYAYYFMSSIVLFALAVFPLLSFRLPLWFWLAHVLRFWVFVGVIFMLLNGISGYAG
ncbi:MAG: UbiA family prenyltransferase [Cloacibacterium sp.]|jgi:4-hydroxybenzoate polyprenyltransferase|nr:UbiA family prenyltransferase [Cloacibacterium sp.]